MIQSQNLRILQTHQPEWTQCCLCTLGLCSTRHQHGLRHIRKNYQIGRACSGSDVPQVASLQGKSVGISTGSISLPTKTCRRHSFGLSAHPRRLWSMHVDAECLGLDHYHIETSGRSMFSALVPGLQETKHSTIRHVLPAVSQGFTLAGHNV